jgi:hypothetical protein
MRPCWVCGSVGLCSHREPDLVDFYIARLIAAEAAIERAATQAYLTASKPPAISPGVANEVLSIKIKRA